MAASTPGISRRQVLKAFAAYAVLMASGDAMASRIDVQLRPRNLHARLLNRDRHLRLERPAAGEIATFCYFRKGKGWDLTGYRKGCHILRDVQYKSTVKINVRLLDLLFLIQAWLRINKLPTRILINSGYRTPQHNATLEGAARNSLHMRGMAADIRIPGVSVERLGKLVRGIGAGGVGFYPSKGFIHVDVGRVRTWRVAELLEPGQEEWALAVLDQGEDFA
ncbi:YcbK family protein [Pseudomonas sp. CR3202]|uniref:YcbK family protein n=1 Tax=Pseudomonas sp. CR3202 TaxID=3351532 RepID=UPI003BF32165